MRNSMGQSTSVWDFSTPFGFCPQIKNLQERKSLEEALSIVQNASSSTPRVGEAVDGVEGFYFFMETKDTVEETTKDSM